MLASVFLLSTMILGETPVHAHYILIFGHQDKTDGSQPDPKTCHSWATWVHADENHNINESFTVSWTGIHGVKFLAGPMPARNLDLPQTLERATKRGLCMKLWGPYRIDEDRYQCAKKRHADLEVGEATGSLKYNLWDRQSRNDVKDPSFNCLHAILDGNNQMVDLNNRYGFRASQYFADLFLQQGYTQPKQPEDIWVWNALRPEQYQVSLAASP
ncbi:hypothetical protein K2X85_04650 [bacterium]|nr:hypothetical protein [bacterium]